MERHAFAEQASAAFGGNIAPLRARFARFDRAGTGRIPIFRFTLVIRDLGMSLRANQIDRIVHQFSQDDMFKYEEFITSVQSEIDEKDAENKPATPATPPAPATPTAPAAPAPEPTREATPEAEEESAHAAGASEEVSLESALAALRAGAAVHSAHTLWANFDMVRRGNVTLKEFVHGVREVLGLGPTAVPELRAAALFERAVDSPTSAMNRRQFESLFFANSPEEAPDFREQVRRYFSARFQTVYNGFNTLVDPILGYVSVSSFRKFLAEQFHAASREEIDAFVRSCVGRDGYIAPSDAVEFSAFLNFLQGTGGAAAEAPDAAAEDMVSAVRAEILDAADHSIIKVRDSLILKAKAARDEFVAQLSPPDLVHVLVHGLGCHFSTAQKTFLSQHCVDAASGAIPIERFIEFYRLDPKRTAKGVPQHLITREAPFFNISSESPSTQRLRKKATSEISYNSSGLKQTLDYSARDAPERPRYVPTASERIMAEPPAEPARAAARPGLDMPTTVGGIIDGSTGPGEDAMVPASHARFHRETPAARK
eukprot:gnl/Chilomastix_cuspidata/1836.p1 GENE.gnl/Chilomastix_cuspidata/1836~~gnl/Chilomastix_cuspidata/1836.p1  ORF type:complete len:542 (+),score=252.63 gnl/Chilomastix_cuspidata/1836:50-1675(+)